ncbi:tRNA(Ile2)-agmatinylcytidine synthase [Halogranum gelatinilyticum]|uniref:tRNA(Ile2) 2-agmatinylcytidine synthetase TiaS n=1 Tax=Halogranum gelatinilyticum TaxID=660521 RepID=A0A1G9PMS9_9EURY|nr:tRNA(Ile)(2)-agmatinylcytidine synthase [Halogranum gelatinilyticum]SDM00138.1 tRNA(Ile2)-agmatinylcytidine synthase [Halogranum gelatinilyticum]
MTVIGLDDTDSREQGMCTTYLATLVAEAVEAAGGTVSDRLLVRLNPAVEHKTRGNAALALHTDLAVDEAFSLARDRLTDLAVTDDPRTSPGLVVGPGDPADVPDRVADFARDALRAHHSIADAVALADEAGYRHAGWGVGRGRIGALAAIGADAAFDDWTYEHVSYRAFDRCGTPRDVDYDSVFAAADAGYPAVWDTVDHVEGQAVCVPHAPGPILYGIRGDDPESVAAVAAAIDGERVDRTSLFRTNQGTDAHLQDVAATRPADLADGAAYRLSGTVVSAPETREGGHVFLDVSLADAVGDGGADESPVGVSERSDGSDSSDADLTCVAFEPTKRFRDRVRALRPGDRLTLCGEVSERTLKLEKFAVRELNRVALATPTCPECGRSMESAGRNQGYRCRDCKTSRPGKVEVSVDRDLEPGWYEVPPCARRHVAKPLVRGGFDAPTHPER